MADSAVIVESSNNLQATPMQSSSNNLAIPSVSISTDLVQVELNKIDNKIQNKRDCADGNDDEDGEPNSKKKKLDSKNSKKVSEIYDKLESRLGGILSCAVCLDLPRTAIFQCQMGHLMCAACFTHLLADGRLRDQVATCPNCRIEISKTSATRNLAVEKAVSELPSECLYCGDEFPNRTLMYHQDLYCEERPTNCQYSRIGCQWRGPAHEAANHELNCAHPKKTGAEVMAALEVKDKEFVEEKKIFSLLIDLLSYEKIIFNAREITYRNQHFRRYVMERNYFEDILSWPKFFISDLQLKPYRTDEYVHKLYYETSKFSAFNHQWVVKARINNSQRDPHQSNERQITYQLLLKTKTTVPLYIHYFAVKGPFSDIKVNTQIYKKCFSDEENESEYFTLPLPDSSECNRLLAAKTINFRLIMFLLSK